MLGFAPALHEGHTTNHGSPEQFGMAQIKLYDREQCPYSQKVREKLDELDLAYDETVVPDTHGDRTEVEKKTGQTGVPVLFDEAMDEDFLADSSEIVAYLDRQYN